MTDLEVFHFLHVLGWALSKMIEMECLNCDEHVYFGGKKKTKQNHLGLSPKPIIRHVRYVWMEILSHHPTRVHHFPCGISWLNSLWVLQVSWETKEKYIQSDLLPEGLARVIPSPRGGSNSGGGRTCGLLEWPWSNFPALLQTSPALRGSGIWEVSRDCVSSDVFSSILPAWQWK